MWPETLWHFIDKINKNKPEEQFKTLKKIIPDASNNLSFKLSIPESINDENINRAQVGYISFTSLPNDLIDAHIKEYGSLAIGFSKEKLVTLSKEKNIC